MAYHILIDGLLHGRPFTRFGDGEQTRSNTYVADCVDAILRAVDQPRGLAGRDVQCRGWGGGLPEPGDRAAPGTDRGRRRSSRTMPERPGDQKHTQADVTKARKRLGYAPSTPVETGLRAQIEWTKDRDRAAA